MSYLTLNFNTIGSKPRTEMLGGREYLVAPMTMVVEGVLNGSRGPLLYPEEEIVPAVNRWNGLPLVVNHPSSGSARTPDVISNTGIGFSFNNTWDPVKRAQVGEAWFDAQRTKELVPDIYESIKNGKKVELSTGLGVSFESKPGVFKSREYTAIARNYNPDHVAILTNELGACSVDDGCGVNNQEYSVESTLNAEGAWRTIRGAKVYIEDGKITKGPAALRGKSESEAKSAGKPKDKEDRTAKSLKEAKDLLSGQSPEIPKGLKRVNEGIEDFKEGTEFTTRQLRDWQEFDDDTPWKSGKPKYLHTPAQVRKFISEKLSAKGLKLVKTEKSQLRGGGRGGFRRVNKRGYKVVPIEDKVDNSQTNNLPTDKEPIMCKQVLIDDIVENSNGLWTEEDRVNLDAFSEDKLKAVRENIMNMEDHDDDDDDDDEDDNDDGGKAKMTKNSAPVVNEQPKPAEKIKITLEDLPEELQEDIKFARNSKRQHKADLIERLVANHDDEAKKAKRQKLSTKTLAELEELAEFVQPVANNRYDFSPLQDDDYSGAAVGNSQRKAYKPEPLGQPRMDFANQVLN